MGKYEKALEPLRTAYELLQGDPNVYLTDHKVKQASYGYKEMGMFDIMSYIPFVYNDNENTIQPCGIIICLIIIWLLLII